MPVASEPLFADIVRRAARLKVEAEGFRKADLSGDLGALSRQVREILDAAGLQEAIIVASGDLNEDSIAALVAAGAPIDLFGVAMREIEITSALAHVCAEDLPLALEILTRTDLAKKILDRVIPLDRLVDDGLSALAERRASGKILVDPRS